MSPFFLHSITMKRRTKLRIRKRAKLSKLKKINTLSSADRISAFPDHILCHVLSFLPTKFSVATSILATRWRSLWTEVPNLDFDFADKDVGEPVINRVMLLHKVRNLDTFRLHYSDYDFDYDTVEKWLQTAIARNVKCIDLDLTIDYFPKCVFACKTLVDLKIVGTFEDIIDSIFGDVHEICLPSLKKLHLCSSSYPTDKTLPRLLSGCPVLEELIVDRFFDGEDGFRCCVSSPSLKRFTVIYGQADYESHEDKYFSL